MTPNPEHRPGPERREDPNKPESAAEARARVERARRAGAEAREAELNRVFAEGIPGGAIIWGSVGSTAIFTFLTVLTVIWVESMEGLYLGVSFAAFLAGIALFAVVLLMAASRSRSDAMGIGGLFFLLGCAPRSTTRVMNGSLALAVLVSVAAAIARPRSAVVFGTLEPMLPLALSGLWGVRHGHFPQRQDDGAQIPAEIRAESPESPESGPETS